MSSKAAVSFATTTGASSNRLGGLRQHEDSLREPLLSRRVGSLLAAPVVARDGSVEGALVLVHEAAYVFDLRDEELVAIAASHAASASKRAPLRRGTRGAASAELAELELRAGEARLRIAVEAAGVGTWDFNPLTEQLRWDARCKALAGLPADADVDWSTFVKSMHPDDRERVRRRCNARSTPRPT